MDAPQQNTGNEKLPAHVAIIMDGNGRWATTRGLSRTEGHRKGAETARHVVTAAGELGIQYLTLFAFSSENWNRPADEVADLMNLLRYYLKKETAELHKNGAQIRVIGDRAALPRDIVKLIENTENLTRGNAKITVVLALNYGGRQDIVCAAKELAKQVKAGEADLAQVDENSFSRFMMTADIPDPDLMIRTSGESRISNFLLWQMAYAELYFTDTLWPDFTKEDLTQAVAFFTGRNRRYGGLSAQARGMQG